MIHTVIRTKVRFAFNSLPFEHPWHFFAILKTDKIHFFPRSVWICSGFQSKFIPNSFESGISQNIDLSEWEWKLWWISDLAQNVTNKRIRLIRIKIIHCEWALIDCYPWKRVGWYSLDSLFEWNTLLKTNKTHWTE